MEGLVKYRLCSESWEAQELHGKYPPKLTNKNKKLVFSISCGSGAVHKGTVNYSRWKSMRLPSQPLTKDNQLLLEVVNGGYQYDECKEPDIVEWHVNFADRELFKVYGGPLFAQDESQVTEHPVLASVREAALKLQSSNPSLAPITKDSQSTPILIRGVERRVKVCVDVNANEGRPNGLYGNNFMNASEEAIRNALILIDPPTITNIIAIEAPKFGSGEYSLGTINDILSTAYTGFKAAVVDSMNVNPNPKVVINTGYWGCGAYGGNKTLMILLQIAAAHFANIYKLVFHAFSDRGPCDEAIRVFNEMLSEGGLSLSNFLHQVQEKKYKWGVTSGE